MKVFVKVINGSFKPWTIFEEMKKASSQMFDMVRDTSSTFVINLRRI